MTDVRMYNGDNIKNLCVPKWGKFNLKNNFWAQAGEFQFQ